MQTGIPTTLMRGGTSKGLYFAASDLPTDETLRGAVLCAAMGSPDMRQIDGVGGAHPLTSKVAIISPSSRRDADVDYLFQQVTVDRAEVSGAQNCGNILAGVGPWAIENGLVGIAGEVTKVRIHMVNTGGLAVAHVPTLNGSVCYEGDTAIDGVPGAAAAISIDFLNLAGASTGALLPTGQALDVVDGVEVTCIDNGMPVVLLRARDLGLTGYESPSALEGDGVLKQRVEAIRLAMGPKMNLGDVTRKTVPKMCLIAEPQNGGVVMTRTFIPHRVHEAIGALGAVSVATACIIPNSVAAGVARILKPGKGARRLGIEHPSGVFGVEMDIESDGGEVKIKRSALIRTARKLMRGEVYVPASLWSGP